MDKKMEKTLNEIVYLRNQIDGLQMLLDGKKEVVKKYFENSGESNIKNDEVTAFVQTRTKVNYDIDAIKSKLDKDLYSQFIATEYSLNFKKFKKICKIRNIDPRIFRESIIKTEHVDEKKLDQLYEYNEITVKDLEGCYDAQVSKTVSFRFFNERKAIPITK